MNSRRAKEINAAAKQGREFFRNANDSDYTVRPLLTFYGVACLSRALILLLKKQGGEEGLTAGHGLETVAWGDIMSGEPSTGLQGLHNLKIRTCSGTFSDLASYTKNITTIHDNSSAIQWKTYYNVPDSGKEFTFGDLLSRIPDLERDYGSASTEIKFAYISQVNYNQTEGFRAIVDAVKFKHFQSIYKNYGYEILEKSKQTILQADSDTFCQHPPMFIHAYIHKIFTVPKLHIVEPLPNNVYYSQICMTYVVSYILGMLVRYFPTHWISLTQGYKGDSLWPTINRTHQLVEQSFPELVIELITDALGKHSM